jgi:hypothetical protein
MKQSIKQATQLLLTISLIVLMVDGGFIANYYALHHDQCQTECIDFPNHFEHSHTHTTDDLIFKGSSTIQLSHSQANTKAFPTLEYVICDNYISCIWQPPKIS